MSLSQRFFLSLGIVSVMAGCPWSEEAALPVVVVDPALLHPLDQAQAQPWVQQVWFVADPGERVDAISLTTDGDVRPILALAKADGSRRVVVLDGPGEFHVSGTKLSVGGVTLASGTSQDGAWRAMVSEGEHVQVTLTDKSGAGGRVVALRDVKTRKITHPSVSAGGSAVVVAESGELGGLYRIALPDGPAVRIVPETSVVGPVVWTLGGQERVAYVEQSDLARVIVALPPGDPPQAAVDALRTAGVPATLVPAVRSASGGTLRPKPCAAAPPIRTGAAGASVSVGAASASEALACGQGCLALLSASPSGAPRILASILGTGATRDVWFDPSLGVASGTYTDANDPSSVEIDVCLPPMPVGAWLATTIAHASPGESYDHLSVGSAALAVIGRNKVQPISVLLMAADRDPILRPTLKAGPSPDPIASTPDGSVHATVDKGAVVWWSARAEDDRVTVFDAAPDRAPQDVVFDDPGTLYFADAGAHPGLYRLTLQKNEAAAVLPWPKLRHPMPVVWDGEPVIGVVRDAATAVVARPLTAAERAAWDEGPITLARVEPSWSPVEDREGGRVRCAGPDVVQLGLDEQGGYFVWGATRLPVRAAVVEDGILRVLADDHGVPSVVAERRTNGDVVQWWPRGLRVKRVASSWVPTPEAEALPDGGACTRRP